jgi:hypothetical protein
MATHSPAPWHDAKDGWITDANGLDVCVYAGPALTIRWPNQANFQLALAAPDLLAACKEAEAALGAHGPCRNNSCKDCRYARDKIRAAILKAKGGAA